jgi:hypothetical protein
MDNKNENFLLTLKDNLHLMKDLLHKKIQQHEDFLNNKDGRLQDLLKAAQAGVLVKNLKQENDLTDEQIKLKAEEINKLSQEFQSKIK